MKFLTALCLTLSPFLLPQEGPQLTPENLDGFLEQILPPSEELAWERIEWRTSLGAGIVDARAADKPVLLWVMNGHPLGCV
ncbi:MAG: hypothetical protein ACI8QS_001087 [Planctomycetota bacterium]|jgi:hypothetical protein